MGSWLILSFFKIKGHANILYILAMALLGVTRPYRMLFEKRKVTLYMKKQDSTKY